MTPYYQDDPIFTDQWHSCYDDGWQGEIVPESFSHPAKFSRRLIRRIYEHAFAEGWLAPGMTVVDPFGGVALGALDALWNGLTWVGVELEPKFVALGKQNLALWQRKYGSKEGFGSARIIQGDSRRLAEVIGKADLVCSSPPYVSGGHHPDQTGAWGGQAQSVPRELAGYGKTPGQLGAMKEGDFDCVVGSPPFSDSLESKDQKFNASARPGRTIQYAEYGRADGQLSALPEGRFEAVISSPPYEEAISNPSTKIENTGAGGPIHPRNYSADRQNLGNSIGPTFWSAAREIVAQCHAILKPGGHAIWVTKRFVRGGKIVEFSDQWQSLCESVGFRLVCRHRAMLVANHGEQETIFGEAQQLTTARKSFFRRLAERKGSPAIDFEDVLCFQTAANRMAQEVLPLRSANG